VSLGSIKGFYFNYTIKAQSLKAVDYSVIILIYSNNCLQMKICGYSYKDISIPKNNYTESISERYLVKTASNIDELYDYVDEYYVKETKKFDIGDTIKTNTYFIDTYPIDDIKMIPHTIVINEYTNAIGSFSLGFQDLINFINKINSSKCSKVKFNFRMDDHIELSAFSTTTFTTNNLVISFTKYEDFPFETFDIDSKFLESLRSINVAMSNNKKKIKKYIIIFYLK